MARTNLTGIIVTVLVAVLHAGYSDKNSGSNSINPIRRVVTLLQKMAKKVEAEGQKEKELYDKFMCYCQTGSGELAQSIALSDAKVPQLQSDIESAEAELAKLKQDLKIHQDDRTAAKAAEAEATSQREGDHKEYVKASDEYKMYLNALGSAIPAIMRGMAGGFLQSRAGVRLESLEQAVSATAVITDYDRRLVISYLTADNAGIEGYVPASAEIVGILKTIQGDFKKSLAEVEKTEAESLKVYEELVAAKSKQIETLTTQIEKKTERIGELQVEIVTMKNDLTDSEAALIADKKLKAELASSCSTKTAEWEERRKTRAEELVAIHETIKILNDDDALELFKKTLSTPSLLQFQAGVQQKRQRALGCVRRIRQVPQMGNQNADFLALALSGQEIDFTKVVKMIDDMVGLLKMEQADDDNKKDYCEKAVDSVEDKAKQLTAKVEDLETIISAKQELIATVTGEIKDLTKGITELDKSVAEATDQRKSEHSEFVELMSSNSAAKELLNYAKSRLHKFYSPKLYKASPKEQASEEDSAALLVQITEHQNVVASKPAPATWTGSYQKSGENKSVISMIDLLIKELDMEITEAQAEEKNAQKEYETVMDDAAEKRAADLKSIAQKERAKAEAEEDKAAASQSSKTEAKELQATKMYEMQLHKECDWLIQNFDLRKQARSEEMDNLKQAKAILSGADFSLMQGAQRELKGLRNMTAA